MCVSDNSRINKFVDLKSNSALLYNKGHNFWKSFSTWKFPQNWIFPYFQAGLESFQAELVKGVAKRAYISETVPVVPVHDHISLQYSEVWKKVYLCLQYSEVVFGHTHTCHNVYSCHFWSNSM